MVDAPMVITGIQHKSHRMLSQKNVEDLCHDLCVSTVAAKIIFKSHYLFLPKKKYLTK